MAPTTPSQQGTKKSDRGARFRRSFAQSNYVTTAWTWFMVLAGKAAEPVLVASVLYASVKLLPIVHFPAQFDAVVFIAQFIALDVGGLSLNKLADQATKDGNAEGAKQAKRLSIALVSVMLAGVIVAGINQVIKLDGQAGTIIDTLLLIARAIMAVLYSRVIHALKKEDIFEDSPLNDGGQDMQEFVTETVNATLVPLVMQIQAKQVEMIRDWSQRLEQVNNLQRIENQRMLAQIQEIKESLIVPQAVASPDNEAIIEAVVTQLALQFEARFEALYKAMRQPIAKVEATEVRQIEAPRKQRQAKKPASSNNEAAANVLALRQVGTSMSEMKAEVYKLMDQGLSSYQIAPIVSKSPATVQRWMKDRPADSANLEDEAVAANEAENEAEEPAM